MPEAIATTKRKFYKALDSFTSSSQISLVPSETAPVQSAKRPTPTEAFDAARDRARKRLRNSSGESVGVTPSPPVKLLSPRVSSNGDSTRQTPPNFSPWSHDLFLARLETFSSVSLWYPKPEPISEVEWAKRGWSCVEVNTVCCRGGCEKRVVISLDTTKRNSGVEEYHSDNESQNVEEEEKEEDSLEQALAARYQGLIARGHAENCLWRRSGCKNDIYHLQVIRSTVWQPHLRERYRSILNLSAAISSVPLHAFQPASESDTMTSTLLDELPPQLLELQNDMWDRNMRSKALTIALHGWYGSEESGTDLLKCAACFQRIGLWMYQPGYKSAIARNIYDEESSTTRLELIDLHREHCPWRNADSQKAPGSMSGMNATAILYRSLIGCARDHKRQSRHEDKHHHAQNTEEVEAADKPIEPPQFTKEEVIRQDKERESKLKRLRNLLNIKRRSFKPKTKPMLYR